MPSRVLDTAHRKRRLGIIVTSLAAVLLSACAGLGDVGLSGLGGDASKQAAAPDTRNDLEKATDYWSKEYAKDPKNAKALLSYTRNLRALGQREQALAVLQAAGDVHGGNREYLGEYGRLALEANQIRRRSSCSSRPTTRRAPTGASSTPAPSRFPSWPGTRRRSRCSSGH